MSGYFGYIILAGSMFIDGLIGWIVFIIGAYMVLFGDWK